MVKHEPYTKEQLQQLVDECDSLREILVKTNRAVKSNNYDVLRRAIKDFGIDITQLEERRM